MSVNLLQKVQQELGYPELIKIDPNTNNVVETDRPVNLFAQAAIPAVLTAMYKYVQTDDGANEFLRGDGSTDWVGNLFPESSAEVISKIENYAAGGTESAKPKMNEIAAMARNIVKKDIGENASTNDVKEYFLSQRNNILPYLQPELNMGNILNDDTVDDNVNKMEGPVSSLIKSVGAAFSKPVTGDEVK